MSIQDCDYFERRAEAELALAVQAEREEVVRAHYELACAYLERLYPEESSSSD